jgi:hypothetical protein
MKRFQCSYLAGERPQSMEICAKDAQEAVCAAIDRLGDSDYRRMEISDEAGLIYFRQGPSRCIPSFRKFVSTQRPYIVRGGIDLRPQAPLQESTRQDTQRLAS